MTLFRLSKYKLQINLLNEMIDRRTNKKNKHIYDTIDLINNLLLFIAQIAIRDFRRNVTSVEFKVNIRVTFCIFLELSSCLYVYVLKDFNYYF